MMVETYKALEMQRATGQHSLDVTEAQQLAISRSAGYLEENVPWVVYSGVDVRNKNGTVLSLGNPPYTKFRIFVAPSISWQPNQLDEKTVVRSAKGLDVALPPGNWNFPSVPQYGVACFSIDGTGVGSVIHVEWTQPVPYVVNSFNGEELYELGICVNDIYDPDEYLDNAGSLEIFIAKIDV